MSERKAHIDPEPGPPFVPPRLAHWFLEHLTDADIRYAAVGDFAEIFNYLAENEGLVAARSWYWQQALKSVPNFLADAIFWKMIMLRNYLKITVRNLAKQKFFSAINIAGLSVGIACFLLISMYVSDELSFDNFHENADNIYRVLQNYSTGENTPASPLEEFQAWGSARTGPALVEAYPEVLEQVRFSGRHQMLLARGDRSFQEDKYMYVDGNVFSLFSFRLLRGNPATALMEPSSIVLSESAARRYFGDEDPMGELLSFSPDSTIMVTGVMEDVPSNSHLEFNMLISMSTIEQNWPDYMFDSWGYVDFFTFIRLQEGANIENLAAKMPEFYLRYRQTGDEELNAWREYAFENVREAYLSPTGNFAPGPRGNRANLVIFSAIAFFILLIACVNYMNLSTARSSERAREIGIRKVMGAQRPSLVGQFLAESVVFAGIAIIGAFVLAAVFLPAYSNLAAKNFTTGDLFQPSIIGLAALVVLVVGLLAGSYPALVLSQFQPVSVLKGAYSASKSGTLLRKGLVVFQFGITFALIAGAITAYSQLDYMQSQRLGFDKEQMMTMEFGFDDAILSKLDFTRESFLAHPAVSSVSIARTVPGEYFPQAGSMVETMDGEMIQFGVNIFQVDHEYIDHFGLEMAAGRAYSRNYETDLREALVINEAFAHQIGYPTPEDAIGKRFNQWGREGLIIGVVKDFNYVSLAEEIEPLSLTLSPGSSKFITVKLATDDLITTVADMEELFKGLVPHRPFINRFLDETFDAQYRTESQFGGILSLFAGLAIFIACLGLFGLTAAVAAQRRKEIGVRKVMGASAPKIVYLLSKDFARLVMLAVLIATPIVYFGMNEWLNGFAFRTNVSIWTFLKAGTAALIIAVLTMNYQTIRAALANPVDVLRSE